MNLKDQVFDKLSLVFGYGTLQKAYDPPKTMSLDIEDEIHGDMYDLGFAPAAINIGKSENRIKGQVELIHEDELKKLDKREAPTYKRIKTKTKKGFDVWVYEYKRPISKHATLIEEWKETK